MKILIAYHCLLFMDSPPELRPMALSIVQEQMEHLQRSGLLDAADEMIVGINGGVESAEVAQLIIPAKARIVYHGLQSRAENLTIVELERWAQAHPDWLVFYHHAKGCTHPADSSYGNTVSWPWRRAMMDDLVGNWRTCVAELQTGFYDVVCSHFMRGMADGTQHIAAGNFWWATSSFIASLPSIYLRERIKLSGIAAAESRFEAEVWLGNGRMPRVREFRPGGGGGIP